MMRFKADTIYDAKFGPYEGLFIPYDDCASLTDTQRSIKISYEEKGSIFLYILKKDLNWPGCTPSEYPYAISKNRPDKIDKIFGFFLPYPHPVPPSKVREFENDILEFGYTDWSIDINYMNAASMLSLD